MILYLTERYLMSSAFATVVLYNWNAISNFLPIFGAVLADACLGRFRVIALGSFVSLFVSADDGELRTPGVSFLRYLHADPCSWWCGVLARIIRGCACCA
jgi:hypothetical protein